jgi:hypothetical protein
MDHFISTERFAPRNILRDRTGQWRDAPGPKAERAHRDRQDGTATAELPYRALRSRMVKKSRRVDSTPRFGALLISLIYLCNCCAEISGASALREGAVTISIP